MKLHCHRQALMSAFSVVGSVVPTRTPKEVLQNVKLHVEDGNAVLIGTDQEVGIRYEVPGVEAEAAGETLLPARRVSSILHELTDEGVDLEITEEAVWIRSGQSEFRLPAQDPAEFPPVGGFDEQRYHAVPSRALRQMIRRTIFATDEESTRYALGGILLELEADQVTMAATDSRRLAVVHGPCRVEGEGEPQESETPPVIPAKAMSLIERSIADDDEEVFLAVHPNDVLVKSGVATIYSRLVEGRFPRYKDVIPRESNAEIELVAGPFHTAVRQSRLVTDDDSRGVDFVFSSGVLRLKSQAANIGEAKIELPIAYEGPEIGILFDPRYVSDFLKTFEPEQQLRLKLIDSESAAVFEADDSYTYVIMPLARER